MRSSLLIAFGLLLVGSTASAQDVTCLDDADCMEGEICLMTPCADGETCTDEGICAADTDPMGECETDADCMEGEACLMTCAECADADCEDLCFGECVDMGPVEPSCLTDDDCGAGMTCEIVGGVACAEPVCPEGEACDPVPCEEETIYACVPAPEPECQTDADCGAGFVCASMGGVSVGGEAPSESDAACAQGDDCSGDPMPYPEEDELFACVPAQCESDADCGDGLVCFEFGWSACPAIACAEGEDCPDVECTEETESYCAPAYIGGCEVDADCGEGFSCEAEELCTCSGGAVPMPEEGGDPVDPEYPIDDDCSCAASGDLYCAPIEQMCGSDADCVDGWTCDFGGTSEPGRPTEPDTDTSEIPPTPAPVPMAQGTCMPPYSDYWAPSRGGGYEDAAANAAGQEPESGVSIEAPQAEPTDETDATRPPADDGGCQVAPTRAPLGVLLGGLFGLVALGRRRRR